MAFGASVTFRSLSYSSWQLLPQLIPGGSLLTVPLPSPALPTDKVKVSDWKGLKVATHVLFPFMATMPSLQSGSPFQPAKLEPGSGLA